MARQTVSWIPAHPMVAGLSMQRYWFFMQQAADRAVDLDVSCVLGRPQEVDKAPQQGRLTKAFTKYIGYPLKVKLGAKHGIYHILDHGWAHMMNFLPQGAARIVTVHDLIPLRYPDALTKNQLDRVWWVVNHIKKCQAVISDSEHTKYEIVDLLKIPGERIHVIPLGVAVAGPIMQKSAKLGAVLEKIKNGGAELIIGCLGATGRRKNIELLLGAVTQLRRRKINVVVLRAGPPPHGKIAGLFDQLAVQRGLVDLGMLKDSEIAGFYASIDVLCMPSLYEGFGLPVIEAMAAGTPVICSNATSLPEVAGDAAITFDPNDREELEDAIVRVMDPMVRAKMAQRGRARAADFTWDRTLQECRRVYQRFSV